MSNKIGGQLQAGYLIESIKEILLKSFPGQEELIESLYHNLSYFDIESNIDFSLTIPEINPTFAVLNNIVTRGLPTRLSLDLEQRILNITHKFEKVVEYGTIKFKSNEIDNESIELLFRSLHIIDPRINRENALKEYDKSWERLGSEFEEDFLYKKLSESFNQNGDFIIQLFETQRSLPELLKLNNIPPAFEQNFTNQRVDFSIEFPVPFAEDSARGVIIEVDGSQHNEPAQHNLDIERDNKAKECDWSAIRIKTSEWNNVKGKLSPLSRYLESDYYKVIRDNYSNPIWEKELGKEALQLILTPFALARIQKTLIEFLLRGALKLSDSEWKIAVIEKDVPCSALAFEDIFNVLKNLYKLQGLELKLPEIKLQIYSNDELCFCKLNEQNLENIKLLNEAVNDQTEYDLVIDISILERKGLSQRIKFPKPPKNYAVIRSIHSIQSSIKIYSAERIKYQPICIRLANDNFEDIESSKLVLTEFLRNIFRKEEFRLGQLPILNRALQLESVIGLLQTGGGKSLTYQLAALLQPGITIIIDPIKSLMKDQVDGLKRNFIDSTVFINSTLKTPQSRKAAIEKMSNGQVLYVFVSPERLQIVEFRNFLNEMPEKNIFFTYCVIDEAHCVSEWGHDFRTSYLKLGKNAITYCQTKNHQPITLFGLTATASFDVLADVQRELADGINNEMLSDESIIRYETTNRPELHYHIQKVSLSDDLTVNASGFKNIEKFKWALREKLGIMKKEELNNFLSSLPSLIVDYQNKLVSTIRETYEDSSEEEIRRIVDRVSLKDFDASQFFTNPSKYATIIFCPHRKHHFGVTDKYHPGNNLKGVYDNLRISGASLSTVGTFIGVDRDDDNEESDDIEKENIYNQENFINNKLNIMVCTKAFGMGIDKPNVRSTIHFNYPGSIESFVQEAGRAGRDGYYSLSTILFNDQVFDYNGQEAEIDKEILHYFHFNSFKGKTKELVMLNDLLEEISFPKSYKEYELNEFLKSKGYKGLWVLLHDDGKLHLKDENKNDIGHINLNNLVVNPNNVDNRSNALTEIKNYFRDKNITRPLGWFYYTTPGIFDHLELLSPSESKNLVIHFNNNWENIAKELQNYLKTNSIAELNLYTIQSAIRVSRNDLNRFKREIKLIKELTQVEQDGLSEIFIKIRDKMDTEKAIYRLSILGIIKDHTIDYSSSTISLTITKISIQEIFLSLKIYLLKYYSAIRTDKLLITIAESLSVKSHGESLREFTYLCIDFLIDFIYSEIERKRFRSINTMKEACIVGLDQGGVELRKFIDLYFNSKYAREEYFIFDSNKNEDINASLLYLTNNSLDQNIVWVWDFIDIVTEIDKTGSQIENLKHLRGATTRLLISNPKNATLLLLKSFATFVVEETRITTSKLVKEAIQDFINGFTIFQEDELSEPGLFDQAIEKYRFMLSNNTHVKIMDEIILAPIQLLKLRTHRLLLEKFNKSFLVDYERINT